MSVLSPPDGTAPAAPQSGVSARAAIIGLTAFLTVVDLFATQAILPSLARAYRVAPAAMSLAVNATTLGMAVASVATAFFAHCIDRRRGVVASLALLSLPTMLLSLAPDLTTFAALRILQGICMATAFSLTLAYLGERFMAQQASSAFAAYIAGNVASNLFGRLLSAGIADHFGLAANFVVFAGLNLAGAALVAVWMRSTAATGAAQLPRSATKAVFALLRDRRLAAAFALGACILFAFIGTFTFVNFVLVAPPLSLGMMSVGLVYLVFLPSIPTTLMAGALLRLCGTRKALGAGLGLALLGLPLLVLPALPAVLVGLTLVAVGTFLAQAIATGFVGRHAAGAKGTASGLYLASYFSGGLLGTALLGAVFDAFGWTATVAGIGVVLALAACLARLLTDEA